MVVGHCWANWPLLDPRWPLHDLWPQQCISLCSGVLPTKFGDHRALLSKLTLLDPSWPLHDFWPQQCTTLWSGVLLTKFGSHRAFLDDLTSGWPLTCRVATKSWLFPPARQILPRAKFQLRRSKHGRTHSETDRQTDRQTDRHGKSINIDIQALRCFFFFLIKFTSTVYWFLLKKKSWKVSLNYKGL